MNSLQEAIQYSLGGPLHKAIQMLEEILEMNPGETTAVYYLADVYSRLGRQGDALLLLSQMKRRNAWTADLEAQYVTLTKIHQDLNVVKKSRFRNKMFLSHAIAPDGEGGYSIDTLGYPGTWSVQIDTDRSLPTGAYLRLLKSLAWLIHEVRNDTIRPLDKISSHLFSFAGHVRIEDNIDQDISFSFVEDEDKKFSLQLTINYEVLFWKRQHQRNKLKELIERGNFVVSEEPYESNAVNISSNGIPKVVLISLALGLSSDYAVTILCDRLKDKGIESVPSFIRSFNHMPEYLDMYEDMTELGNNTPNIFAISVLDVTIKKAIVCIAMLREKFPQSFIIIGGPASQTPEQVASLISDFDVLIRGDGDEILPQAARIIGSRKRSDGLSEEQIQSFKKLPGGLILQHKGYRLVHRLDHTNVPEHYHLQRVNKKKTIYYWQTSRGCPYDCRFCYKWTGIRYHMVVPWRGDPGEMSMARRSALAMSEFLLSRLALEWPDGITISNLEKLLKETEIFDKSFSLPSLREKIFIVIEDDDFLINRERIREFHEIVRDLGLQRFFVFSAITSVRTLYRGGNEIDREILEWLKDCNFKSLDIGSDGLCQHTIDENNKGYSLDRHVIPLNSTLKDMGFFAFNNTIVTTPYTTVPQFIESLIFYTVCPYPINIAIEIGIMGHIGTSYTNEDIVNQQYDWRNVEGKDYGTFKTIDRYLVPVNFPEYALNDSHFISYADPKIMELIVKFPDQSPIDYFYGDLLPEDIDSVVQSWVESPGDQPEMKALGKSIILLKDRNTKSDFASVILHIKEEMSMLGISSFTEYYCRLKENKLQSDPQFLWVHEKRGDINRLKKLERWEEAIQELNLLVQRIPSYFRAHQELIILLLDQNHLSAAVEHFTRYQVIEPNLIFYHKFFDRLMELLNLKETIKKERAFFHIPRYYTISPVFYFLALLKEYAGNTSVEEFSFGGFSPRNIEDLYDLFDYLTIDTIKETVSSCDIDINDVLQRGERLHFMGVPVKLANHGKELILDYKRINPSSVLVIEQ